MIEEALVHALLAQGKTVATAESLTAGLVSARICNVSGASGCFLGGVAAYQDAVKEETLGVPAEIIRACSAVSASCARAMAKGVRKKMHADVALSTTGYAGPTGEDVGLVYVGLSTPKGERAYRLRLHGTRQGIRQMTANIAMYLLQKEIENNGEEG